MKIIHIKQVHKLSSEIPVPSVKDIIIQSQFEVAREIKNHPGCPVVDEGLYNDGFDAASLSMSRAANTVFPKGFPANFNELSPLQQEFLYAHGGALTLFYLGEIPSMYKSIHKEISDDIDERIRNGENYRKFDVLRETEVIACAKEAASNYFKNTDGTVIIVFGAGHDLKSYCDKEGFEYEVIDTSISTSYHQTLKQENNQETVPLKTPNQNVRLSNAITEKILESNDINKDSLYGLKSYVDSRHNFHANSHIERFIKSGAKNSVSNEIIRPDFKPTMNHPANFFSKNSITVSEEPPKSPAKSSNLKNCLMKGHITTKDLINFQKSKPGL